MDDIITKVKKYIKQGIQLLPVYFSKNVFKIFLGGLLIVVLWGSWMFYSEVFSVIHDEYDVFVRVRDIDEKKFDRAFDFIKEQQNPPFTVPSANPFVK